MSIIEKNQLRSTYLNAYEESEGTQAFQNAEQNYSQLKGMQTNSYKCFLVQGWMVGRNEGTTAFLHPEGLYDDPNGGKLRRELYPRLRGHFQFQNEKKLFPIANRTKFSINVYRNRAREVVSFRNIANLFVPKTIDACFKHDGGGPVPGIKDENHDWNTEGHAQRIVTVDHDVLELFATLYDEEGTPPREARLSAVHSEQILEVLRRFAEQPQRLGDLDDEYFSLEMWHETNAQEDGTIKRDTQFVDEVRDWILSGPHIFVSNPLHQTPERNCNNHRAYDQLDLTNIPADYIPRSNYIPSCSRDEYDRRTPKVPWSDKKDDRRLVTEYYRLMARSMLSQSGVRTLTPAILPKGTGHIDPVHSLVFADSWKMVVVQGLFSSVPFDFWVKVTGNPRFRNNLARQLPFPESGHKSLGIRSLILNCLTTHYADLWDDSWQDAFTGDTWTKDDPRLTADTDFSDLTGTWDWDTPLRTRYARRQALVELDVLAAQALGLTLDELQTIYRVQFPVLRKYEQNTWYDQNGRIIYTKNRGLPGVGFKSKKWKEVKDITAGTVEQTVTDDTQPGGPVERTIVYEAPFTKCDREADYERAWGVFEEWEK